MCVCVGGGGTVCVTVKKPAPSNTNQVQGTGRAQIWIRKSKPSSPQQQQSLWNGNKAFVKITEWLPLIQTCLINAIKWDLARGGKKVLIKS